MINILFISSSLEKNGTEEFMMNVLRGLDRKSYHADFLIFSEGETENSKEAQSYLSFTTTQEGAHLLQNFIEIL